MSYEDLIEERRLTLEEGMEMALPEEENFWDDFETAEEQSKELRQQSKARRAKHHRRWKASQEKDPEVRNYRGADDDGKGPINWEVGK